MYSRHRGSKISYHHLENHIPERSSAYVELLCMKLASLKKSVEYAALSAYVFLNEYFTGLRE